MFKVLRYDSGGFLARFNRDYGN